MNHLRISALELEHFQSIEQPARIEFAPLTLFYGPNSAGKSAVFDAIEFVREFWNPFDRDEEKIFRMVDRWARKTQESSEACERKMCLAIEFPFVAVDVLDPEGSALGNYKYKLQTLWGGSKDEAFTGAYVAYGDLYGFEANNTARLSLEVRAIDRPDGRLSHYLLDKIGIEFNGKKLLEVVSGRYASSQCRSEERRWRWDRERQAVSYLYDFRLAEDIFELASLDACHFGKVHSFSGDPSLLTAFHPDTYFSRSDPEHVDSLSCYEFFDETRSSDSPDTSYVFDQRFIDTTTGLSIYSTRLGFLNTPTSFFDDDYHREMFDPVFNLNDGTHSMAKRVNYLFSYFGSNLVNECLDKMPPTVIGDRSLPKASDLSQLVDLSKPLSNNAPQESDAISYYYSVLARSAYAAQLKHVHDGTFSDKTIDDWQTILIYGREADDYRLQARANAVAKEAKRLTDLNELFSDQLFSTHLYQMTAHSQVLIDFDPSEPDPRAWNWGEYGSAMSGARAMVQVAVLDTNQNKLSIQDVGSGIGYALPFLVALTMEGVIRIQQPELHLHPALQSNLGDLMLSKLGNDWSQVIVETHSEHLLLRVLKRVRQSANGSSVKTVRPEDVAIYYFEPVTSEDLATIGSSTVILKQELADDGDFVNYWPNGFFEERWRELRDHD